MPRLAHSIFSSSLPPSHFTSGKPEACATFKWHSAPITSIEWHPTDASVIAVSGEDDQVRVECCLLLVSAPHVSPRPDAIACDFSHIPAVCPQVSLWDMAVEADDGASVPRPDGGPPVPPQLLFVHQVRASRELTLSAAFCLRAAT